MSAIDYLLANYARHIRLPWSINMAGAQRVWFAVYPPAEERRLRARLPQFETATLEAGHTWTPVDFTKLMPEYLASHRYRDEVFAQPQHLRIGNAIEKSACALIKEASSIAETPASSVIALTGLASLFDVMRVSSLIEAVEDSVPGRLLVFFPGDYAGNVYRFMDARDGFNYMAVPITSTESFINP